MDKSKGLKIMAMIPARMGSTRLKKKNLALIAGKPMIYYAIEAAKASRVFDRIVVNSEDAAFGPIAEEYGVEFYQRPTELGSSQARSDEVVYDFMKNNSGDITAWVNSTSPLQTGEEVKNVVQYFRENDLDSLITVRQEQVHCLFDGRPLNYKEDEKFARTQDLVPIERFVYSVMMWKNSAFMEEFKEKGYSILCGKTGYFPVSKESSLIVKTQEDLQLIDHIVTGRNNTKEYKVVYG